MSDPCDFRDELAHGVLSPQFITNHINALNAVKEHFIARYLADTGAKIEDTQLVERHSADGLTVTLWCEPRKK
jgi:hypothetical protein